MCKTSVASSFDAFGSSYADSNQSPASQTAQPPSGELFEELARLEALHRYRLLDTPAEEAFDDFTRLAAHLCGTPMELMTLLDSHRQWFRSRIGLDLQETDRDISFCDHAIRVPRTEALFVVPDAQQDARFADNPLVMSDPSIRFYAGAPIVTPDGHALGTLCVLDRIPRELTAEQRTALSALSRQVMHLMEMRRLASEQRQMLIERHLAQVALSLAHDVLEQQLAQRTEEVQVQFRQALESLAYALEAKDAYTDEHSMRVCALAVALAQAVRPGDDLFADQVQIAARLHDIGKIGVPEAILQKSGRLSHDEFQQIKKHPAIGSGILLPLIKEETILTFVRHHHERWDGDGYPDGLAGTQIPLGARILAVADAFDAMTSHRPYRAALTTDQALETLIAGAAHQWDADIVNALVVHLAQQEAQQPGCQIQVSFSPRHSLLSLDQDSALPENPETRMQERP